MTNAVFAAPPKTMQRSDRNEVIAAWFTPRAHQLAATLPAGPAGETWIYAPKERGSFDPPAGHLIRADGLKLWLYVSGYDADRVSVSPSQVLMPEPGRESPRHAPLIDFVPYEERRHGWKAEAGFDLTRFIAATVATIANAIARKVLEPCAAPFATATQRQHEATVHANTTEAAAAALAAAYGGEMMSGKNGYHPDSPVVYTEGIPQLSMIEVRGADSFLIGRHGLTLSRRVLDTLIAALKAEATESQQEAA